MSRMGWFALLSLLLLLCAHRFNNEADAYIVITITGTVTETQREEANGNTATTAKPSRGPEDKGQEQNWMQREIKLLSSKYTKYRSAVQMPHLDPIINRISQDNTLLEVRWRKQVVKRSRCQEANLNDNYELQDSEVWPPATLV